ncbi:salicylate hydroxylase [Scheffersomyces xylosifermentans]|uniref:salicylate hydroxylase n=1 Tax=Scheffersomyces xylosifermentans TaxID=1304137 RepID=UPI00315C61D7
MTVSQPTISKAPITLDILVVGAGLGGMTASIGLALAGHNVTVLESAHQLGEVGAGIQIPPPSVKILETIGALDEVLEKSTLPHEFQIHSWKDGKVISKQNLVPFTMDNYHSHYLHIHRADYHHALVDRAQEVGVKIVLNARVNHIDFESATVTTLNGEVFSGDVVVGYDGIKSRLRTFILGYEDLPYDTGDLAYRAILDASEMKHYPELASLCKNPNIHFWWGPDCHVVLYMLQGGNTCNVVILTPDTLPKDVTVQEGSVEELLELFKDWDPILSSVFKLIHSTSKWRLQNSQELKTWTHEKGNVIILGDAAHATLPYLASGASQALEDAAVLSGLFSRIESKDQIHDLLELTESLRKWRSTQVVLGSTQCRKIYHMHDGPEQELRDKILAESPPKKGCPNRWADPVFQKFLWGYEAFHEAERGWEEYKKGKMAEYTFDNLYDDAKL